MSGRRVALGALAAAGLLAWAGGARAEDTVRLNLTGDTPTLNLVETGPEADTIAVARGGFRAGGGGFRAGGGGFRPGGFRVGGAGFHAGGFRAGGFRSAGFRPGFNRVAFNRGFNRFAFNRGFNRFGFNRFAFHRGFNRFGFWPGFGGWGWGGWGWPSYGLGLGYPWYDYYGGYGYPAYYSNYYAPSIYYSDPYYGYSLSGGGPVTVEILAPPTYMPPADTAVPVAPPAGATYPYDGGPQAPVPMPRLVPSPTRVPPTTAPAPADGRVVSLPQKPAGKWAYPAYGEPARRTSFAEDRTLLTQAKPKK